MKKTLLLKATILNLLIFYVTSIYGYMEFLGYQKYIEKDTLKFRQVKLGTLQLELSEIQITPKGSYLDIIEDAWISSNLTETQLSNLTEYYLFKGTLSIPAKAAVTGLHTWKYNTLFRAKLILARITLDKVFLDSLTLKDFVNKNISRLEKQSEDLYTVTFTSIDLGERKHIRIRYLLPNTGNGTAQYTVPILFHCPSSSPPKYVKVTVMADSLKHSYILKTTAGDIQLKDNSTVMIPYQQNLYLTYANNVPSAIHRTIFTDGTWQGNYLLLNTKVPDSVFTRLSHPMEAVFLLRWNRPFSFITIQNQMKTLSSFAYKVLDQFKAINQIIQQLSDRGHRCGFIHSVEGKDPLKFSVSSNGDQGYKELMSYIAMFNEQYLYDTYKDMPDDNPDWVLIENPGQTILEKSRAEFLYTLQTIKAMYATSQSYLKHFVVITAGSAPIGINIITPEQIDSLISGITCDATNSSWRGVDCAKVMPSATEQNLQLWNGYYFPSFQPTTLDLKVYNTKQPFSFPLPIDTKAFAIAIKSSSAWDSLFYWTGYYQGQVIGTTQSKPLIFDVPQDSGLVKVWARDENHVSEKEENNLGGVYGFVTKAMYLRAGIDDISSDTSTGVPFLTEGEIVPIKPANQSAIKLYSIWYSYINGVLTFSALDKCIPQKLKVYDLKGRQLLSVDLSFYRNNNGNYLIKLGQLLRVCSSQMLFCTIQGIGINTTFKLILNWR